MQSSNNFESELSRRCDLSSSNALAILYRRTCQQASSHACSCCLAASACCSIAVLFILVCQYPVSLGTTAALQNARLYIWWVPFAVFSCSLVDVASSHASANFVRTESHQVPTQISFVGMFQRDARRWKKEARWLSCDAADTFWSGPLPRTGVT